MKNNSKKQNNQEFCRNARLEEQGFSPCPFSGIVISDLEKIPFEDGKRFLYKLSVQDEDYWKISNFFKISQYFWAKDFSKYKDEEWLKEILKPGTKIKFHGDFVKVENTRIEGFKSNWEVWEKQII